MSASMVAHPGAGGGGNGGKIRGTLPVAKSQRRQESRWAGGEGVLARRPVEKAEPRLPAQSCDLGARKGDERCPLQDRRNPLRRNNRRQCLHTGQFIQGGAAVGVAPVAD